jgi:uncharacterized membrane protein
MIAVRQIEDAGRRERTLAERFGDNAVRWVSTLVSLGAHLVWFTGWIVVNSGLIGWVAPFDPYPYSFLTFVVSLEAIILALLILMSQNRASREAERREALDLQVNLLAEAETTKTLQMLQDLCKHFELPIAGDPEVKQFVRRTVLKSLASGVQANESKG